MSQPRLAHFPFATLDVFTDRAFGGNPLAVLFDARGLSDAAMQRIAREMNLSETTFVLPPSDPANHHRVRIFTPTAELPMAGHPTVGTAFALASRGAVDLARAKSELRFELGVGPVPVEVECAEGRVVRATMRQPLPHFGEERRDREAIAAMLGLREGQIASLPIQAVSCGVPFLIVPLRDAHAVAAARADAARCAALLDGFEAQEILCFTRECIADDARAHARMFAPRLGIAEDPATGGAAGPLAAYLDRYRVLERRELASGFVVEQGIEMGRPSRIEVRLSFGAQGEIAGVFVGGACVAMSEGTLTLGEGDLQ